MKHKIFFAAAIMAAFFSLSFSVHAVAKGTYMGEYTATQAADRGFEICFSAWADESVKENIKLSETMLVIDMSDSTAALSAVPEKPLYKANTDIKSIDTNKVFYTLQSGGYKQVHYIDGIWQEIEYKNAAPVPVKAVSDKDKLLYDLYEGGNIKTKNHVIREAVSALVDSIFALSPNSSIGVILVTDEITVISPQTLSTEFVAELKDTIAATVPSGKPRLVEALTKADEILSYSEVESKNIVCIAAGMVEDNDTENEISTAQFEAQNIKMQGITLYAAGLYKGLNKGAGKAFIDDIASSGFASVVTAQDLGTTTESFSADILGGAGVVVAAVLDPRFTIEEPEIKRLRETGAEISVNPDNTIKIEWGVSMPRAKESAWDCTVKITPRADFVGGNDITVCSEASGIYHMNAQVYTFEGLCVNVPIITDTHDREDSIFLGQKIPASVNGTDIEKTMIPLANPNWYGRGETGTLSYLWSKEDDGKIGQTKQLSEVIPSDDATYTLTVLFTPSTGGTLSTGKQVEETKLTAEYKIKVVSGSIRIKLIANGGFDSEDSFYIFRLQGDGISEYRVIKLADRGEDGQGVCLETAFSGLPYGKYSITQVCAYESGKGLQTEEAPLAEYMLGYQENSEKINIALNRKLAVITPEKVDESAVFSAVGVSTYQLDF